MSHKRSSGGILLIADFLALNSVDEHLFSALNWKLKLTFDVCMTRESSESRNGNVVPEVT